MSWSSPGLLIFSAFVLALLAHDVWRRREGASARVSVLNNHYRSR